MDSISTIIWDWNGTLLDDIDICIDTMNGLLGDRGLPLLNKEKYHDVFGFPVIDYYRRVGFNFDEEPFEIPAHQYIENYTENVKKCGLQADAITVLDFFRNKGLRQVVLSASESQLLEKLITHFNIGHYFDGLSGLDNHLATSKVEIGISLLSQKGIQPGQACLIGDTTHDFEVARQIGCSCILVANGHQPKNKLDETGALVVEKLEDAIRYF